MRSSYCNRAFFHFKLGRLRAINANYAAWESFRDWPLSQIQVISHRGPYNALELLFDGVCDGVLSGCGGISLCRIDFEQVQKCPNVNKTTLHPIVGERFP